MSGCSDDILGDGACRGVGGLVTHPVMDGEDDGDATRPHGWCSSSSCVVVGGRSVADAPGEPFVET